MKQIVIIVACVLGINVSAQSDTTFSINEYGDSVVYYSYLNTDSITVEVIDYYKKDFPCIDIKHVFYGDVEIRQTFCENGFLVIEARYVFIKTEEGYVSRRDGDQVSYYCSGGLRKKAFFIDGKQFEEEEIYHEDGTLDTVNCYFNGLPCP